MNDVPTEDVILPVTLGPRRTRQAVGAGVVE